MLSSFSTCLDTNVRGWGGEGEETEEESGQGSARLQQRRRERRCQAVQGTRGRRASFKVVTMMKNTFLLTIEWRYRVSHKRRPIRNIFQF